MAPRGEEATPEPVVGQSVETPPDRRPEGEPPAQGEGQAGQQAPDPSTPSTMAATTAGEECPRIGDEAMAKAIERELKDDEVVPEDVEVNARYGVVTLSGTVDDLLAEQRAIRVAETVRGVKVVVDDLEVKAPEEGKAIDDQALRRDVQQALLDDPTADAWQLDVAVKDGSVTLGGTVDSWVESAHAMRVVEGVRGVSSVDNRVTVKLRAERPDDEIEKDVQTRLRWDALVADDYIDVRVSDGDVRLVGTVGSAAQRRRARTDAWVIGVGDVDASDLQVDPCVAVARRDPAQPAPTGEEITRAIELAMALDPTVASYEVKTQAVGDLVTLTGTVDNARAREAAERIATHTVGVSKVDNRIEVRPKEPVDDQTLATRIDQALLRNAITESYEIDVAVQDGRATLTGNVDNYAEYSEAADVANGIAGVVSVDNQLTVTDPAPFVYDPYVVPYHSYAWPGWWHGTLTTTMSDAEIADEIRDELFWSPFVDRNEVQVTVENGKATLRGTVDSWQERHSATENAYEGGAVSVDNQLKVGG